MTEGNLKPVNSVFNPYDLLLTIYLIIIIYKSAITPKPLQDLINKKNVLSEKIKEQKHLVDISTDEISLKLYHHEKNKILETKLVTEIPILELNYLKKTYAEELFLYKKITPISPYGLKFDILLFKEKNLEGETYHLSAWSQSKEVVFRSRNAGKQAEMKWKSMVISPRKKIKLKTWGRISDPTSYYYVFPSVSRFRIINDIDTFIADNVEASTNIFYDNRWIHLKQQWTIEVPITL